MQGVEEMKESGINLKRKKKLLKVNKSGNNFVIKV